MPRRIGCSAVAKPTRAMPLNASHPNRRVNLTPDCRNRRLTTQPAPRKAGVKIRPPAVKKPLRQALSAVSRDALGVW